MSDLLGLPCVHGEDATICKKCWGDRPNTPEVAHHFSWLPFGAEHPEMVVAVCDCGWSDLCMGPLGTGMDAAHAYAEHVGYVSPSDDIKPTCPPHGPDVKTDYLGYTYCGRCGRLTDDENAQ